MEIQETDGSTLEITDKIPLERVIIEENLKKYHQTKGACPWLGDPRLYIYIGAFGEVPRIESIPDGTYVCPYNTNQSVKKFLRHLQCPITVSDQEPPTFMIMDDYREPWKIVK